MVPHSTLYPCAKLLAQIFTNVHLVFTVVFTFSSDNHTVLASFLKPLSASQMPFYLF